MHINRQAMLGMAGCARPRLVTMSLGSHLEKETKQRRVCVGKMTDA